LIEPGGVVSNFMKGSVLPKNALDPNSPYSELVQQVNAKIRSVHENATQPEKVAETIFQAISVEKPEYRYLVGYDAIGLSKAGRKYVISGVPKDDNTKCHTIVLLTFGYWLTKK